MHVLNLKKTPPSRVAVCACWSPVALPAGRSENAVKNRFYSTQRKLARGLLPPCDTAALPATQTHPFQFNSAIQTAPAPSSLNDASVAAGHRPAVPPPGYHRTFDSTSLGLQQGARPFPGPGLFINTALPMCGTEGSSCRRGDGACGGATSGSLAALDAVHAFVQAGCPPFTQTREPFGDRAHKVLHDAPPTGTPHVRSPMSRAAAPFG